jgi:hypothetical protein
MKKIQHKSKRIEICKIEHKLPLKPSHKDGKHQSPPPPLKIAKREESRDLVKMSSNCLSVSHLNISLLYMVSQEVVSPLKVPHYFVEDWVFGYRHGTGFVTHEGNSLKAHSKVSHGVHNP